MIAWLVGAALAQDPAPIEIVVVAEGRLAAAKEGVHQAMKDQGYVRWLRLGERSWYLNPKLWKPGVMVHEQGFARVRGHPVLPPIPGKIESEEGPDIYTATFIWQEPGKVRTQQQRVVERLEPWLRELRDGHWALARGERQVELQIELARLWFDGVLPDGGALPDYDARRAALVARFRDTTPDEPGEWARDAIVAFVEAEVQTSDHPFDEDELTRAFR